MQGKQKTGKEKSDNQDDNKRLLYLEWFKGLGLLVTCISILAVDFTVFPRTSAKTKEFGISLMDMGGAFFVISSGLSSRWARGLSAHTGLSYDFTASLMLFGKQTVMVGGLGWARLAMVKFLGYQEVVEEYGLHWNFFFTLATVWVLCDVAHVLARRCVGERLEMVVLLVLAFLPITVLQWHLNKDDELTEFILSADREGSFFKENREGLLSLPAYCMMYLVAEMFARRYLWRADKIRSWRREKELVSLTALIWAMWFFCDKFVQQTSRRLANTSFAGLGLALCFSILCLLLAVEQLLAKWGDATHIGWGLASYASLETFLVANVLTGLVNHLVNTKCTADNHALVVLVGYCSTVYAFAVWWKRK